MSSLFPPLTGYCPGDMGERSNALTTQAWAVLYASDPDREPGQVVPIRAKAKPRLSVVSDDQQKD